MKSGSIENMNLTKATIKPVFVNFLQPYQRNDCVRTVVFYVYYVRIDKIIKIINMFD